MRYILASLFVLLLGASPVWALTATQVGVQVQVEYDEPTTSIDENGQPVPLDDLATTNISVLDQGVPVIAESVDATSLTGGGHITHQLTLDVLLGQKKTFDVEVVATDTAGNVSTPTATSIIIDRQSPSPVQ